MYIGAYAPIPRKDHPHHRRRGRHRPRLRTALSRRGRQRRAQRDAPRQARGRAGRARPDRRACADRPRPDRHARAGAGARGGGCRAIRGRRRSRQQHRDLPSRPVRGADRGALRGGARLDPAADLLGLPGRRGAMRERGGGAIVNVGSMWAVDAIATTPTSAYSAAQAGRHVLTKNLAIELAPDNIRVNTVALAFVETPAYERFMDRETAQDVLDAVSPFHPLGPPRPARATSPRPCCSWPATARAGSPARRSRSTAACSPGGRPPCTPRRRWPPRSEVTSRA